MKHIKKPSTIILFFLCLVSLSACSKKADILISRVYEITDGPLEVVILSKKQLKTLETISLNQTSNIWFNDKKQLNVGILKGNKREKYYISILEINVKVPCIVNKLTLKVNGNQHMIEIGEYQKVLYKDSNDKIITGQIEKKWDTEKDISSRTIVSKNVETLNIKNNEKEGVIICGVKPLLVDQNKLKIESVLISGVVVIKPTETLEIASVFVEPLLKLSTFICPLEINYIYNGDMYKTYYNYKQGYTKEIINSNIFSSILEKDAFISVYEN